MTTQTVSSKCPRGLPAAAPGTRLQAEERREVLGQFVDYLEARGIETITTDDALSWASLPEEASATGARSG